MPMVFIFIFFILCRYINTVFLVIDALNISLNEVQLAWDFHTASFDSISERLLKITDMARLRTQQEMDHRGLLPYEFVRIEEDACTDQTDTHDMSAIAYYRINVPWFLINTDRLGNDVDGSILSLSLQDEDGIRNRVPIKGSVGLLIQVPCSLTRGLHKNVSSIVEFGHGIFGNRGIATDDWLQKSANTQGWILWSADWRGLSTNDVLGMWRLATHDISEYRNIEAGVLQSYASKTAIRMILPSLLQEEGCRLGLCKIDSLLSSANVSPLSQHSVHHDVNSLRASTSQTNSVNILQNLDLTEIKRIATAYIGHSMGAIIGSSWVIFTGYSRSAQIAGGSPFSFIVGRSAAIDLLKLAFDLQLYKRY